MGRISYCSISFCFVFLPPSVYSGSTKVAKCFRQTPVYNSELTRYACIFFTVMASSCARSTRPLRNIYRQHPFWCTFVCNKVSRREIENTYTKQRRTPTAKRCVALKTARYACIIYKSFCYNCKKVTKKKRHRCNPPVVTDAF